MIKLAKLLREYRGSLFNILSARQRLDAERASLEAELESLGFDVKQLYGNPLNGIGAALEIAKKYGITLHRGTCFGDCRAELSKEHWQCGLKPDVPDWIINPWIQKQRRVEDVTEISTWGRSVEVTVAKMLIVGRKAGVI